MYGREHERRRKAAAQKIISILLWIGYADCHAVKYFLLSIYDGSDAAGAV